MTLAASVSSIRASAGGSLARVSSKHELRWLLAIVLVAFVLRALWVAYGAREPQGVHDPSFYFGYAFSIAAGNNYALPDVGGIDAGYTAYYPIGYTAALAGVFALVMHTPIPDNLPVAAAYFNIVLSLATIVLVYATARRLFDQTVGLVAAGWLALYPNFIFHMTTVLTETLFIFLVALAIFVLLAVSWSERKISWLRLAAFGLLMGLAMLVRPIAVFFLPILPLVWLLGGFGWRKTLAYSGLVGVAFIVVLIPWTLRNAVLMDEALLSTNTGDNLCIGHNPEASGGFQLPDVCFDANRYAGLDLDRDEFEVLRDDNNTEAALEFARENPLQEIKLLSRKAYYTWEHDHDGLLAAESYGDDTFIPTDLALVLRRVADNYFYFTIALGALGLVAFVAGPRDWRRVYFLLALLAMAGSPLPFFGDARFHMPAMPFVIVGAAWILVGTVRFVAERSREERRLRREGVVERKASVSKRDAL
jgi:4-amino-4-deoxy-L-arabinose transferase-like glycosyltransferase